MEKEEIVAVDSLVSADHRKRKQGDSSDFEAKRPCLRDHADGEIQEPHGEAQATGEIEPRIIKYKDDYMYLPPHPGRQFCEQVLLEVPREKYCFVVGPGGKTMRLIGKYSGALIMATPKHLLERDQSEVRTVTIIGNEIQRVIAMELVKAAVKQPLPCPWNQPLRGTEFEDLQPIPCIDRGPEELEDDSY